MDATELRALQAPLKDRYKKEPNAALVTLKAKGVLNEGVTCKVETGRAIAIAGLHPATGGSGHELCSGDMLLEALVACAGVTLNSVATAFGDRDLARARSRPRATSISAARSASTARRPSASSASGSPSISTPTPPRSSSTSCSRSPNAIAWCCKRSARACRWPRRRSSASAEAPADYQRNQRLRYFK